MQFENLDPEVPFEARPQEKAGTVVPGVIARPCPTEWQVAVEGIRVA